MNLKYFTLSEFDSPDQPGSGNLMQEGFLILLDKIRHDAEVPFIITSGYRTYQHNADVGGVINSSHLRGLAADISASSMLTRYKIIKSSLDHNILRMGIAKTFIHLDNDPSLPPGIYVY